MGRASCCWDKREEQGWRGGGAIGTHPSRGLLFRWEDSGTEEEEDDEAEAAAGSESRQLAGPEGGEVSGPTAPCSSSPAAAACSASRVGEEGGEGRDFFLLEDNSFRRLFFSLCKMKTSIFFFFTPEAMRSNFQTRRQTFQSSATNEDIHYYDGKKQNRYLLKTQTATDNWRPFKFFQSV